jgi:hypothetical protein
MLVLQWPNPRRMLIPYSTLFQASVMLAGRQFCDALPSIGVFVGQSLRIGAQKCASGIHIGFEQWRPLLFQVVEWRSGPVEFIAGHDPAQKTKPKTYGLVVVRAGKNGLLAILDPVAMRPA